MKLIIFDFDGTIADSTHLTFQIYEKLSESFGLKAFTETEIIELKALTMHERLKKHQISIFQVPRLARKTRKIVSELMTEIKPFDGMKDVMETLTHKGYEIGIVSSNSKKNITKFLNHYGFPHPKLIYGKASFFGKRKHLKRMHRKLKSNDTYYVGDEIRDILACEGIEIKMIAVTWGFDDEALLKETNPSYIARKPEEIIKIVG